MGSPESQGAIEAGAGQWMVRGSQMRLTVTGRARKWRLRGERRDTAVKRSWRPRRKWVMAGQRSCDKDDIRTVTWKGVRCRDEERGKGSHGQQLGEAGWRERQGDRAWTGNSRTAVFYRVGRTGQRFSYGRGSIIGKSTKSSDLVVLQSISDVCKFLTNIFGGYNLDNVCGFFFLLVI